MPVTKGSIVIDRLKNAEVGTGFNAATGEWVNMIDAESSTSEGEPFNPFKTPFRRSDLDRSSLANVEPAAPAGPGMDQVMGMM